jgi:myo-inositol-1(or 4)-monophosphatase
MPDFLATAESVALEAGALLRQGLGRAVRIEHKGFSDLVTEYDRRSEALIIERLRAAFPSHAILAEESGQSAGADDSDYEWFVDPLDGTTNFAHGYPVFCVTLGLAHRGRLVAGVVYDPTRNELLSAEAGKGARLNGELIRVSEVAELGKALLTTGFPYDLRTNPHDNFSEFERFSIAGQAVRRPGSAALDCAWVAAGRADGYWEFRVKPWDVAAGILLVREAGGAATTAAGHEDCLGQYSVVVSNGHIHEQMLEVLRQA